MFSEYIKRVEHHHNCIKLSYFFPTFLEYIINFRMTISELFVWIWKQQCWWRRRRRRSNIDNGAKVWITSRDIAMFTKCNELLFKRIAQKWFNCNANKGCSHFMHFSYTARYCFVHLECASNQLNHNICSRIWMVSHWDPQQWFQCTGDKRFA